MIVKGLSATRQVRNCHRGEKDGYCVSLQSLWNKWEQTTSIWSLFIFDPLPFENSNCHNCNLSQSRKYDPPDLYFSFPTEQGKEGVVRSHILFTVCLATLLHLKKCQWKLIVLHCASICVFYFQIQVSFHHNTAMSGTIAENLGLI